MNFCSHCGSDQIRLKIPEGDTFPRYMCPNCNTVHYQNPKIIVGCLVVHEQRILLCRRAIEPRFGLWNLPGGFMENGETVQEGACRETWEEARAEVNLIRLHSVYNLPHVNQVYIHFLADMPKRYFEVTPESSEVQLFAESEIPWDEIAFSSTTFSLQKFFEYRHEAAPPVHVGEYRPTPKVPPR